MKSESDRKKHNKYNKKWRRSHKSKTLEYSKKWKKENPDKVKEYARRWARENTNKIKEYVKNNKNKIKDINRKWRKNNPEKIKMYSIQALHSVHLLRIQAIKLLGNKCVRCGFSDLRALQIDHINGGGSRERMKINYYQMYKRIVNNVNKEKNHYQILCANCNWIKRYDNKENRNNKRLEEY